LTDSLKNTDSKILLKYHFIFWIGYFSFNVLRWGSYFDDYWYSIKSNLVEFPLHIILTYFTIYFLVPKFILTKKYMLFFAYFLFSLTLLYVVKTGLTYLLINKNVWPEAEGVQRAFTFNHVVAVTLGEVYVVALASAIKLTVDWVTEKRKNDKLQKIQLRTELNFLKSQIQPHFFFNTLNSLYALAIEKSDNTPEAILKLSEMMQYVLYEVKEPKISLLKEINYIHSYLELEKLRFGDTIKSKLTISGDIDGVVVPPLLFLPFIENCFKHGAKNNVDLKVNITFKKNEMGLLFCVENNFDNLADVDAKHGIGIENVKRRLQLLYLNKFMLKTNIVAHKYVVELIIPLVDEASSKKFQNYFI